MEISPVESAGTWLEVDLWTGHPVHEISPVESAGTWLEIPFADPGGWSIGTLRFGGGGGWS